MADLLDPVVQSIRQGTALSRQTILDYFKDWDALPLVIAGQHVATAVVKGTEIHFALVPGKRPPGSTRGAVRAFLSPLLDKHGFLTTRVQHHRLDQKRFVQRVGFKPTWRDDQFDYYLLGALPFTRKP